MADAKISALPSATTPLAGTETLPVVQSGTTKKVAVSNLTLGRTMQASAIASSSTTIGTINNAYTVYYSSGYSGEGVIGDFAGYTGVKFYDSGTGNLEIFNKRNNATVGNIYFSTGATPTIRFKVKDGGDLEFVTGNLIQGTAAKGVNFTANTPAAGMTSQLLNWYEEGTWTPTVNFGGATTGITYTRQNGRYTRVGKLVTVTWDVRLSDKGSSTGGFTLTGLPFSAEGAGGGYSASQFYFYSGFTTIKKMGTSYTNGSTILSEVVDSADVAVSDAHFTNSSILFGSLTYIAA